MAKAYAKAYNFSKKLLLSRNVDDFMTKMLTELKFRLFQKVHRRLLL